jgi:hypothetical protein
MTAEKMNRSAEVCVSSRRYAKGYLTGVTEPGSGVQYLTRSSGGQSEEDRYWDTADKQNTAGERLLSRIQEPECRTEKIKSLVYVV